MASMIQLVEIEPIVITSNTSVDVTIKYRDFDRVDSLLQKVYFDFDVIDVLNSKVIATINQKAIKKCSDLTTVATDTITWKNYNLFGKDKQIDSILAYMNSKTKMNVRIKVYSDNSTATGVSYCETTISVATDCVKPKFDISCIDTNDSTINVTGDNQKFINTLSQMSISCADLNTYGASISKSRLYVDGILKVTYTNGATVFNNITVTKAATKGFDYAPFNVRIELTDSRGAVSSVTKDYQLIHYSPPSFSKWTVKRYNNTDRNIQAILEGTVTPLVIDGVVKNRVESIDFRYKSTRDSAYSKLYSAYEIIQSTDDTFEFNTNALLNLDQKITYNLQIYVTDSLSTSKALNFVISKAAAFMSFRNSERLGINNPNPKYTVDMIGDMNVKGRLLIDEKDVTLSINNIASEVGLILGIENNKDVLGLQADYENKQFTRLAGAVGLTAGADFDSFSLYAGMRRCNVADDGTITAYHGDSNYAEDGSNGQVMVCVPKFYYKTVPLKLEKIENGFGYHIRKANYYVTDKPLAGFKLYPAFINEQGEEVEYFLYSAYEGSLQKTAGGGYVNDSTATDVSVDLSKALICSTTVHKPISSQHITLTRANAEAMASNHGKGWHIETVQAVSAVQLLMLIEFGTMNMQQAIGKGVVEIPDIASGFNGASYTGSTTALGNQTGMATATTNSTNGTSVTYRENGCVNVSYRGIENPWGNIWKFVEGINVWGDGTMEGGQAYIASDFDFNDSRNSGNYEAVGFRFPNTSGYINAMGYGSERYDWLLMPSEVGGTSALPVGDYTYVNEDLNGYKGVRIGGSWTGKTNAGMFCWHMRSAVSYSSADVGCRLIYIPQN